MTIYLSRITFIILIALLFITGAYAGKDPRYNIKGKSAQPAYLKTAEQFYGILQGFNMQVWMGNLGCMGLRYTGGVGTANNYGLEYPQGSGIEHIYGAGPWIGALIDTATSGPPRVIKAVSTGYGDGDPFEFYGNPNGSDSFFTTSKLASNGANRLRFDDDGDGKIDEDELDAIDNDHDGRIDEDYGAVSEHDAYVSFTDYYNTPAVLGHTPLGIKVWQRSFAWNAAIKQPILPLQYFFINKGNKILRDVYIGFFGDYDVGPRSSGGYYERNAAGYFSDLRTAYVINPVNSPSTPIGITVLGTPRALDSLRYTFKWFQGGANVPPTDPGKYDMMSSGLITPDEYPTLSDVRVFLGFGPFNGNDNVSGFKPGDTLKLDIGLISGEGLLEGINNLRDNAAKALELYSRSYTTPPVPPSPPLHVQTGEDRVILNWKWRPGNLRTDPLQTWDDSNKFIGALPANHWRRRNPELRNDTINTGGGSGGRTFQGFRIWRSVSPNYNERSFALLAQFDIHDDLGYGEGGNLEDPVIDSTMSEQGYTFIDSNLVRGRTYRYTVTSYTIPGITEVEQPISGGGVDTVRLESAPLESGFSENDTLIIIPFDPSTKIGDVKVVPNPYRTDMNYTFENGGYEGLSREWHEGKRVIWFIHLPAKCTIRIFSLTGDLVATFEHDDPLRQALERSDNQPRPVGQEEWNLLTESGRAIASGVYVFSVESEYGRQVGKFVVIR